MRQNKQWRNFGLRLYRLCPLSPITITATIDGWSSARRTVDFVVVVELALVTGAITGTITGTTTGAEAV